MKITRKKIYSALAGAGVLLGATGLASAASGSTTTPDPAPSADSSSTTGAAAPIDLNGTDDDIENEVEDGTDDDIENEVEDGTDDGIENEVEDGTDDGIENEVEDGTDEDGGYTSTITVADNGSDTAEATDSEATESASLAGLATITADEASAFAQQAAQGTVENVVLENENGNVVYSVIMNDGTTTVDVKVDAGDGTVLTIDSDNDASDD